MSLAHEMFFNKCLRCQRASAKHTYPNNSIIALILVISYKLNQIIQTCKNVMLVESHFENNGRTQIAEAKFWKEEFKRKSLKHLLQLQHTGTLVCTTHMHTNIDTCEQYNKYTYRIPSKCSIPSNL